MTAVLPAVWMIASLCVAPICADDRTVGLEDPTHQYLSLDACQQAIKENDSRVIWSNPNYHRECLRLIR